MRIYYTANITKSDTRNEWLFCLMPTIFIRREDVFNDEKAIFVGIHWLMFQAFIILTKKK